MALGKRTKQREKGGLVPQKEVRIAKLFRGVAAGISPQGVAPIPFFRTQALIFAEDWERDSREVMRDIQELAAAPDVAVKRGSARWHKSLKTEKKRSSAI